MIYFYPDEQICMILNFSFQDFSSLSFEIKNGFTVKGLKSLPLNLETNGFNSLPKQGSRQSEKIQDLSIRFDSGLEPESSVWQVAILTLRYGHLRAGYL